MSYITRGPSPRLAGIVERIWRVEDPSPADRGETICPDGCAEIVIHLGHPMRGQPRHLLVGQMQTSITVTPSGPVTMIGARFRPDGLRHVLEIPQDRLLGQIVPLDAVWSMWTDRTVDQVMSARDPAGQLTAFERALELLLPSTGGPQRDRGIAWAIRAMRARGGPVGMDALADRAGVSRRQFERRFRDHVGLSPHLFGRIVRFQHAFAAVGRESGASLAARLRFVDQAHMVREVRRFSGETPTLLAERTDGAGLTSFFVNADVE